MKKKFLVSSLRFPNSIAKRFWKFVFLFFGIFPLAIHAQNNFIRQDTVPVFMDSVEQPFAWAGGMNSCQFSQIDLNQDGILDLFVFDRAGNKITTYINQGTANQVSYVLASQYIDKFPRMHDWVLLRDYNCDGKMDIFTSGASTIKVYKNISTPATGLQFQLVTNNILADLAPNSTDTILPLNVSYVDIPAIRDVDNDGDLDILTYGVGGTQVQFFRNTSEETGHNCDTLTFTLETLCWGEFSEAVNSAAITLNSGCPPPNLTQNNNQNTSYNPNMHSGGCLECVEVKGNSVKDLLAGNLGSSYIAMIRNGGTLSAALCDSVDPYYPGYDTTLDMDAFDCPFVLDVDNDGKKDLIFAPNALNSSENFQCAWYYHNTGNDSAMHAHLVKKDFLVGQMIDCGEGAYPVFFDYDHDGDQDLFIGNQGYYNVNGNSPSMIRLYKNTGTQSHPIFTYQSADFAGIYAQNLGIDGVAPTFGDIDGDGDEDMICGDLNGRLNLFTKNPGNDSNFVLTQTFYQNIDVGSFATPQLVDVDGDGLLDLLIGESTGNINYYHNDGTATNPIFTLVTQLFGNVIVTQTGFSTGFSAPHLFKENGVPVLLVGSERGFLYRYDNVNSSTWTGNFTLTDSLYVDSYTGGRIAEGVADLNNDSLFDVVIGNDAGGVSLFYGSNTLSVPQLSEQTSFDIYPNPAQNNFTISNSLSQKDFPAQFTITNLEGQIVLQKIISSSTEQIDVSACPFGEFSSGVYVCTLASRTGALSHRKLIVSR